MCPITIHRIWDNMKEEGVNLQNVNLLTSEELKTFFPKLGPRVEFRNLITEKNNEKRAKRISDNEKVSSVPRTQFMGTH
uniref:Uncharacterized protein n=1 Tax=Megaselia scalaris TaxID=36166 RepID=T1GN64_MEGSC